MHRKKHDSSFNCKECQFVAKFRIVLRRQIKEHNKKCHACDFSAATSATLKMHSQAEHGGGLVSNSAGFMITGDGSNEDVATHEEIATNEEITTNEQFPTRSPKKKMTKSEYLKRQMEVKFLIFCCPYPCQRTVRKIASRYYSSCLFRVEFLVVL